jgi:DNA mismatch repair protein MutL
MAQIQCLSPHLADLIAAGEVVERPASVVKELLENAIDAHASAVVVEMEHGGLTYLRVTDNGCGIAPNEVPTAFLRHATSKLHVEDELGRIGTLGFRGEALAAISAVSRVDIITRPCTGESGTALHLEGGVPGAITETGCPEGTTICVRDLFYNTPARMKFMKKDTAEASAVSGIVQHLSLSHPDVSFQLIKDGTEVLHTPGDGLLRSAVYAALGREFALGLIPVKGQGGDIQVEGFITRPLSGHGTRGRQLFFVNGRFIKSQLLSAALEEAYRNQIMKGKFPGCVLHLTLPANAVDVNVHPAKTVVKFVSERAVFDAVHYTVKDTLNPPAQAPAAKPAQPFFKTMSAQEYVKAAPAPQKEPHAPLGSFVTRVEAKSEMRPAVTVHDVSPVSPAYEVPRQEMPRPTPAPVLKPTPSPEPVPAPKPVQETLTAPAPWRIAGEVLRTYIICETEAGDVYLIDKHAAHERLRFDAIKANTEPVMSQQLLVPLAAELPPGETQTLLSHLPLLAEFGFICEDFGGGSLLVREIPSEVDAADVTATLEELAEKLAAGSADPSAARDAMLHTIACKSAIRAGMYSNPAELAALVEKVQSGEIEYCPHGRPVKVKISKYELEKMFKRA